MGDLEEIVSKAVKLKEEADSLREEQKYEKAFNKYKQSLQYFLYTLKHEPNKDVKEMLKDSIDKCRNHIDEMMQETKLESLKMYKEEIKKQPAVDRALNSAIKIEKPNFKWEDLAVVDKAKENLKANVHKGVHGPPGAGKIYIAKACATQMHASLYSTNLSDCAAK
jgi:vacuolar protein-sorting-associated protein 4